MAHIPGALGRRVDAERHDLRDRAQHETAMAAPVQIVNLTPHVVRVRGAEGGYVEYPTSGVIARVAVEHHPYGTIPRAGMPALYIAAYGKVEGMPPFDYDRREPLYEAYVGPMYIISALAAEAAVRARRCLEDLLVPATGHPDTERRDGQVWSVPGFVVPG